MKEYSNKEKSAVVSVLHAIIYADELINGEEIDYIAKLKYDFNVSEEVFAAGLDMEPSEAFEIISAMEENEKQAIGKMLIKMVYIDGKLTPSEYQVATGIMLKCGIEME